MQNGGGLKESSEEHSRSKLLRGISKASDNISLIFDSRFKLPGNLVNGISTGSGDRVSDSPSSFETQSYVFTLPDFSRFDDDFRKFLENDLIESSILHSLELSGHLNWWSKECDCQKLWPLSTSGDGNCLLHAASLGMWGFHDRLLILRKAVHLMLTKGVRRHALWRRWRWQQSRENKESGLIYSEKEWNREWENLVNLASAKPRIKASCSASNVQDQTSNKNSVNGVDSAVASEGTEVIYESLEGLHVFALAHVLRRPIVIASDTVLKNSGGEALSPIHFGGIYLPLECSSAECHRSPLVLCYGMAHFSALVAMQHPKSFSVPTIIPITTRDRELLPLHFAADPGPDFTWWEDEEDAKIAMFTDLGDVKKLELISQYMDLVKIPVIKGERFTNVNSGGNEAAKLLQDDAQRRWNTIPLVKSVGNLYSGGSQTFSRITKSVKQKFMSGYRSKKGEYDFMKINQNQKADTDLPKFQRVDSTMLRDVKSKDVIIGAKLYTNLRSQFMEEMIDNYLKAARTRFEGRKEGGMETTKRERLSRGFNSGVSAEVLLLKSPDNGNSVPLYERPSSPSKAIDDRSSSFAECQLRSLINNDSMSNAVAQNYSDLMQSNDMAMNATVIPVNDEDMEPVVREHLSVRSCSSLSDSFSEDLELPPVVDGSVVTVVRYDIDDDAEMKTTPNATSSAVEARPKSVTEKTEKRTDGPLKIKYDVSSVTTSQETVVVQSELFG